MATQEGILSLRGTIDGITFRKTADGIIAQRIPGPSSEKVLNHPSFEQTRCNANEFGCAVYDAKLLRCSVGRLIRSVRHSKLNAYTNKLLLGIAKTDSVSEFGFRHANAGKIQLLEGFDFNHELRLVDALPVYPAHAMDIKTGCMQLKLPSMIVRKKRAFPLDASHFQIVSCASMIDFDEDRFSYQIFVSEMQTLRHKTPVVELKNQLSPVSGRVLLHIAGIVFFKEKDDRMELLRGGALNILAADRVAI